MTDSLIDRECGFCHQIVDDEDELEPVWIGEKPHTQTVRAEAIVPKVEKAGGYGVSGTDSPQVLGRPIDEMHGLLEAVRTSDVFDLEVKRYVREVQAVGGEFQTVESVPSRSTDNISVSLVAEADNDFDPDIRVCSHCVHAIKGGAKE